MRANRKNLLLAAIVAGVLFFPRSAAAVGEIDGPPRVLETRGGPEARLGTEWSPLAKGDRLPKGTQVRTSSDAWVFFAFDAALECVAQLGPESRIAMRGGADGPVFLEKGKLLLLREPHRKTDVFLIATGGARIYVESGGILAEVKSDGTLIKVFGDRVRVATGAKGALKDVTEGFEFRLRGGKSEIRRMMYADYTEWLAWVKRSYEIKDNVDADALDKEYTL
jgi:hypothetical protein